MDRQTVLLMALGLSLGVVAQNLSPALPVVFLGMRSPSIPLGVWLFIAFTLGLITSRLVKMVLSWQLGSASPSQRKSPYQRPTRLWDQESKEVPEVSPPENFSFSKSSEPNSLTQDWEQPSEVSEVWEGQRRDRSAAGDRRSAQSSSQTKENVYDTDYRVIIPPVSAPPPSPPKKTEPREVDWESPSSDLPEDEDW